MAEVWGSARFSPKDLIFLDIVDYAVSVTILPL